MVGRVSIALQGKNKEFLEILYKENMENRLCDAFPESFNSFVNNWMAIRLAKADYLKKKFPHISYIKVHENLMLLRDSKGKKGDKIVEIRMNDEGQPECPKCVTNKTGCMHATFAAAKPEIYQLMH